MYSTINYIFQQDFHLVHHWQSDGERYKEAKFPSEVCDAYIVMLVRFYCYSIALIYMCIGYYNRNGWIRMGLRMRPGVDYL